jgi:hypothetical protein
MTVRDASLVTAECDYAVVNVADNTTTVYNGPCLYFGASVTTVLSAHALPVVDGSNTVDSFAASAAVGTSHIFLHGVRFNTSLIVNPDDAATGAITVFYRPLNA